MFYLFEVVISAQYIYLTFIFQDTVIALRAMTQFSILKTIPSDVTVDLSVRGQHHQLSIDNGNKLNVQGLNVSDLP